MGELRLFDSHLHLTDERFGGDLDEVLARAASAGVGRMVTIGTSPEDAGAAAALAESREGVWHTAGLHPHEASRWDASLRSRLESLLREGGAVAVGETGLDFHYDHSPREAQRRAFRGQLELAAALSLPVVVHSREADEETAALLRNAGPAVRGVLHCFTGGDLLLDAALEADWYVSFSGIATFRSFGGEDRVRRVPDDRLLIETDSPYLAPVPERGHRNEPAFVAHTCRALARMREAEPEALAGATWRNACAFYGMEEAG